MQKIKLNSVLLLCFWSKQIYSDDADCIINVLESIQRQIISIPSGVQLKLGCSTTHILLTHLYTYILNSYQFQKRRAIYTYIYNSYQLLVLSLYSDQTTLEHISSSSISRETLGCAKQYKKKLSCQNKIKRPSSWKKQRNSILACIW